MSRLSSPVTGVAATAYLGAWMETGRSGRTVNAAALCRDARAGRLVRLRFAACRASSRRKPHARVSGVRLRTARATSTSRPGSNRVRSRSSAPPRPRRTRQVA